VALNSRDCFILNIPSKQFVWFGQGSTEDERRRVQEISKNLVWCFFPSLLTFFGFQKFRFFKAFGRSIIQTDEGKEPGDFWKYIGGESEYANAEYLKVSKKRPFDYYYFESCLAVD